MNTNDYTIRLEKPEDYYRYCGKQPSRELILHDLHITPPNTSADAKYYVGFYDLDTLVAIMDLIDGYPDGDTAFIGFFMMNRQLRSPMPFGQRMAFP